MAGHRILKRAVGSSSSVAALLLAGLVAADTAAAQRPSARYCATERALGRYPPGCPRPSPPQPSRPQPLTPPPGPGPTVNASAADLRVGARVRDLEGTVLGTILTADATGAVVNSSMGRGRIPLGAFGRNNRGLVLSRARLIAGIAARSGPRPQAPFTVFFDNDRDEITAAAAAILDNAAAAWRRLGDASALVILAGHTDSRASDEYNVELSQRMANNVRTYLVGRGVPRAVISTEAYGESRPRVETPDGRREPDNRRVEISFLAATNTGGTAAPPPRARGISITSRCTTPLVIRITYFDGVWRYPTDTDDGPGLWWPLAPGATIRPARTNRSLVEATSNEIYYSLYQGTQPVPLTETTMRGYGQGQSYPFRRARDVTINSNGDWSFQIC